MKAALSGFAVAVLLLGATLIATAQQTGKALYRIGLIATGASDAVGPKAFRAGMRELGYVEGGNLVIDGRYATGRAERLVGLAREVVTAKPDVIVVIGTQAAEAAKAATQRIPIVMALVSDAVGTGLVPQLARPGGNVTGLTMMMPEISAKRLQLLKEVLPRVSQVAVLWNPADPPRRAEFKEAQAAAVKLGITIHSIEIRRLDEFDRALAELARSGVEGVLALSDPFTSIHRTRVIDFATRHRLPVVSSYGLWAESGALLTYGPDLSDIARRAATYVDKILKGARPEALPVEQPTKFELLINLKTAKALGITIPRSLLLRADQVIE